MIVKFSNVDFTERPVLILKTAGGTPIGILGAAFDISCDLKYNETSTLEFTIPYQVAGEPTPHYDEVVGMRTIELLGIGQFTVVSPEEIDDGVVRKKTVKAYSLEYEFAWKKISLEENTYRFWSLDAPEDSILGIIMERMPSWKVGRVGNELVNRYRTFEVSNENLYSFMKNTLQQSYGCIFDFDTETRTVHVRDVDDDPMEKAVYIAPNGLAKEITVTEDTEGLVTRLDVNGADDVDIRDVNPTGTNKLIDISYYMNTTNFSQDLIDRYNQWTELCASLRDTFYNLSVQYTLQIAQKVAEEANLTDLNGEKTSLENIRAVVIQAIAQKIETQERLDEINAQIAEKEAEISDKEAEIATLTGDAEETLAQMQAIRNQCAYEMFFTEAERLEMDRYMKDGDVSESSFVFNTTKDYTSEGSGQPLADKNILVTASTVLQPVDDETHTIWTIAGGTLSVEGVCSGHILSGVAEVRENHLVATFNLTNLLLGGLGGRLVAMACVTVTGESGANEFVASEENAGSLVLHMADGYMYATEDTTEYQRRQVGFDLYEYGVKAIKKLSRPSYTFSVDSTNFMAMEDFTVFRNQLTMGERIYLGLSDETVMTPICVGVHISWESPEDLTLEFSDTYTAGDSAFKLVDLLEQSVSSGKSVELGKYNYQSFVASGAYESIKKFMQSAMDASHNQIIAGGEMAITYDGSGLHLRRWADEEHTAIEPEEIWLANNSVMMTTDNWQTAQMTIGKFVDDELGEVWGIAAPMVVGTLVAGSSLVIESEKRDGGIASFRVDGEGVRLHNADFSLDSNGRQIVLNAELGIAIGTGPLYIEDDEGNITINEDNCNFWVDKDGNISITGVINNSGGTIGGLDGWQIGDGGMYTGTASTYGSAGGIWMGNKGVSFSDAIQITALGSMIVKPTGEYKANETEDRLIAESDQYVLKVMRTPIYEEDQTAYTVFVKDGSIRRVGSATELNNLSGMRPGDLAVLASESGSSTGLYIYGNNRWNAV